MAKITWTKVSAATRAARGLISEYRTKLTEMVSAAKQDRVANTGIISTIQDALRSLGIASVAQSATVPLYSSGGVSLTTDATVTVVNGVITEVRIPATTFLLRNGSEFVTPQATGTYVNGYTPTISGGFVTALLAS